jgi:uncharacterized protein YxeA
MKNKYLIYIILPIILIAISIWYFNNPKEEVDPFVKIKEDVLKSDKLSDEEIAKLNSEHLTVTHYTDKYVRLKSENLDVYMINSENDWQVVEATESSVSCERMERFGFPSNFISDCYLEFPKVIGKVTLDEAIEGDGGKFEIIATISEIQDPYCNCLKVELDDSEYSIDYVDDEDLFGLEGEEVVLDVSIEDGEILLEEIIDIIDDIEEDYSYLNNEPDYVEEVIESKYYIDRDYSNLDIQIIGD